MKRVLIIEDNEILAENFERILRADFKISKAQSAGETIQKIDENFPDLILLDILLKGHSAFAILNELQTYADTAKIPVVVCSDLAENLYEKSLKNYGIRAVLDKSKIRPGELRKICAEISNE